MDSDLVDWERGAVLCSCRRRNGVKRVGEVIGNAENLSVLSGHDRPLILSAGAEVWEVHREPDFDIFLNS